MTFHELANESVASGWERIDAALQALEEEEVAVLSKKGRKGFAWKMEPHFVLDAFGVR